MESLSNDLPPPVKRHYEFNAEGLLVEKVLVDTEDMAQMVAENQAESHESRGGGNFRRIASIPTEIVLKWLYEENIPGYMGQAAMDHIINKKLRDPDYNYLLTVPESYRSMRYGA